MSAQVQVGGGSGGWRKRGWGARGTGWGEKRGRRKEEVVWGQKQKESWGETGKAWGPGDGKRGRENVGRAGEAKEQECENANGRLCQQNRNGSVCSATHCFQNIAQHISLIIIGSLAGPDAEGIRDPQLPAACSYATCETPIKSETVEYSRPKVSLGTL